MKGNGEIRNPGGLALKGWLRWRKNIGSLLGIVCALTLATGWGLAQAPMGQLDIRSESLSLDTNARRAEFKGNVVAENSNMVLKCQYLLAKYDAHGQPYSLEARGEIRFSSKDIFATAGKARYTRKVIKTTSPDETHTEETLELSQSPIFWKDQHRLTGTRIKVELNTGKITVIKPHGQMGLPHAKGKQ